MINILFSGNHKVFDGILTTALSICKRTKTKEPLNIYVFTMNITRLNPDFVSISDEQIQFLQRVLTTYNPNNKITKVDVGELYEKEFALSPNEGAYCTPYTLLRLLADLVEDIPDKLLYLDCDILFNRDIELLYNINIDEYEYAAARDHYGKYLINPNYINAGVLLFNMKKAKETGLFEKSRKLLREKKLTFADQDALWHSTTNNLMLSQKFNDQKFLHKHTVVRHFSKRLFWSPYPRTENIKQWNVSKIHKRFGYYNFDDILYEYIYLKQLFENNFKIKGEN